MKIKITNDFDAQMDVYEVENLLVSMGWVKTKDTGISNEKRSIIYFELEFEKDETPS